MQRDPEVADPTAIDMHRMGTVANIVRYITAPDGTHHLVCQGEQRFQVVEFLERLALLGRARAANSGDRGLARRRSKRASSICRGRPSKPFELLPQAPPDLLGRDPVDRLAGGARRSGRRLHGREAGGEAGNPRDGRHRGAHGQGLAPARAPHRSAAAVAGDRTADQGGARRAPARGAAARADGGDPAPARRRRGGQGRRDGRARQGDHQCRHAQGGRGAGAQGIAPAAAHAGSGRRIRHGAHLSRLADRAALETARGKHRSTSPQARRILDEDHYDLEKIKRRIIEFLAVRKLSAAGQGADPVLRRPARRRQDLARPIDRARDESQVRARQPRRRA